MKDINLKRRQCLLWGAAGVAAGLIPAVAWTDEHEEEYASTTTGSNAPYALASTGLTANIVVVGGGMAGATVAKYLRMWGGTGVNVTLLEPDSAYTSNIMSNLVLNGSRTVSSLAYAHTNLSSRYGVLVKRAALSSIDSVGKRITLSDASTVSYDRLVLAPGVEFEDAYGLTQADYSARTPHAWRAGAQTQLLRDQLVAMPTGGTFVMTIPKAPYRCPPGPYERACLVADYLKTYKGSSSRVIVLDENASIQAEVENFTRAFSVVHAGVIDYRPGVSNIQINPNTKAVSYLSNLGVAQSIAPHVVNPIAPHRAAGSSTNGWLAAAGLANSTDGRWAKVDVLSYASTAQPNIHIIGDAAQCGLPKAGHVANQEAKICADAIIRLLGGSQPDPAPVANSACYSPITASTASWLTAVYQYDSLSQTMKVANGGGNTLGAKAIEAASISSKNFSQMGTWFNTLMGDSFS